MLEGVKSFNSTLVQLKSKSECRIESEIRCFNSTLVQLKNKVRRRSARRRFRRQARFNSTLVQLKKLTVVSFEPHRFKFQFHIGSIKNSKTLASDIINIRVSIPHWFN